MNFKESFIMKLKYNFIVNEVADKLEQAGVLRDKQNFKNQLLSALDAESQKKAAEQEKILEMLKELEQ